jgi:agmatine deiminase
MAWPTEAESFMGRLDEARNAYANVARAIARFEPVTMVVRHEDSEEASRRCGPEISLLQMPLNDAWMRDMGPSFLIDGRGDLACVSWRFNAWGERGPHDRDEKVAGRLGEHLSIPVYSAWPFVLEGGAFHVDGEGTLITTESCLLNRNRNPALTREQIEQRLRDYLGVERILWLQGNPESGTDGHVDGVACFVRPGVVMLDQPKGPDDPMKPVLEETARRLRAARDAKGRGIEIIPLVQPRRRLRAWPHNVESRLTYVNFYIANGGVVMPAYDDPEDDRAAEMIAAAFPGREVVQVPALDIARGGGMIHCITQQQPVP